MGLLLSVLVVCVGVVEVIACVRHFQSSYLPLWAPHRIAPGYTDVHELWRTKPNSDLDYRAPLGAVASSKQIFCRENAVRYCVKQHDTTGQVQEEGILSDVDSAKNVFGSVAYSALSPHENVCESGETHSDDSLQKLFGDITSIENNLGSSHCCDWNIDIQSSDSLSPGTEQPFLPSCPCAEDFGPYPSDVVRKDSEEIASQDEIGNKILKVISSQQVSDEPTEVPYSHTEFSSRGVETGEDFPVDPVCVVALEPCPVELLDEKLLTEPADETGDVSEEDIPPCSVERKKCPSACEDGFKNTADEVFEIANAVSSSACTHDFTTSADEVFQIADPVASSSGPLPPSPSGTVDSLHKPVGIEHSHPCNVKTGEDFIFNKDKEYPYVVRSPLSTPSTPRKSKADIKWPTFTADPVIKRPSVALTNTFTSFDSFDLSADSPEVIDESSGNKDSEAVDESEKSEKQFAHDKVHAKEGAGKELSGSPAVDSGTGESRDTGDSNFSDMELLGETSISVIPGKEFSKKEIMLKRRRSYKSRRQSSSAESASGSEKDDRSFGEEKTGARESRRRFRKSSKYNSAEDASYFEEARTSSSHLSRVLSNPESDSAKKLLEEWQACSGVEPDELGPTSRNKWIVPESLARGVETVAEEVVHQVDNGVMQDVTESNNVATASGDIPMLNNSSGSQTQTANEDLNDAKKDTSKEAFWLIFSGEYTKAMSKDWHSGHFCCWQCDESLTGQRYVLRDDHPYCIKCYESVFANVCEECNKTIGIDSKDLSYKDKHWHEACFLCNKCRISLVDKQFGSKADKIYCGNCYDAQFASRCDGCGEIFRAGTKKMEYKTRQWHEKCFCCCVCKTAIGTKSFIPREQEIYCATCYEEKFATRCVKCKKIITSGGVTYKNEPWHRECFTCTNCNTSLAGQRFTSRDEKPYCAECFGELFAKRCTACSKPITGIGGTRFISFEDRHWHNDCFICAACKTSLVGRGFITDADDIICPECAKQKLM